MRLRPISRDEVRSIDRRASADYAIPGAILMENAGRGVAERLVALGIGGPVVIGCGKGNNGGDGFVVARHLDGWGHRVTVLLLADRAAVAGDALANLVILEASGIAVTPWDGGGSGAATAALREAGWIVDAILGTGTQGEARGSARRAIDTMNSAAAPKIAIDIPSGLDCDTGRPLGTAVRALHTATLVSTKIGFAQPGAAAYTGAVSVVDIGLPARLLAPFRITDREKP